MFKKKDPILTMLFILLIGSITLLGCQSTGTGASVETPFEKMEEALKNEDEALFKSQWHAEGYRENLVGGSGMAGSELFEEGRYDGWYLNPDMQAATERDGVYIVPSEIRLFEEDRSVDEVYAAVVQQDENWLILGAGEELEEVEALVDRYLADEPLSAALDE